MAKAKQGDTVRVHYTGKLDDDTVFDSSVDRDPLEFTLGENQVIIGFEEAVAGLSPGESVETRLEPAQAYGERRDDLLVSLDRAGLPDDFDPSEGDPVQLRHQSGETLPGTVVETDPEQVQVDVNHPLAGKHLNFEIELVEIV